MSAREALIFDVSGGMSVADAAAANGVARSCASKWVERFRREGLAGLAERSRRPESSPKRTPQAIVDELLALKAKYQEYGPAKLVPLLDAAHGKHVLAVSTAGEILKRSGLVQARTSRRSGVGRIEHGPYEISGAGDTLTTDFKGQFRMGNGQWCYPLTICDPFSRYILDIVAMPSTHMAPTRAAFDRVFREHGVPRQMISDNGTPFCGANSLGGLTQLSRWWIELGIIPVRISPGRPDQNAIHERMHRTLKAWITRHERQSLRAYQKSFDQFKAEFNFVRPHQALGQKAPSTAFKPYRPYPKKSVIEYDSTMEKRKVNANGEIKWNSNVIFTSEALVGAHVGLLQIAEHLWSIYFGPVRLGYLDTAKKRVMNRVPETETTADARTTTDL